MEAAVSFIAMFSVYRRLLFVVLYALHTNLLPATRDICTQLRWHREDTSGMFRTLEGFLFVNVDQQWHTASPKLHEQCNDVENSLHHRMTADQSAGRYSTTARDSDRRVEAGAE